MKIRGERGGCRANSCYPVTLPTLICLTRFPWELEDVFKGPDLTDEKKITIKSHLKLHVHAVETVGGCRICFCSFPARRVASLHFRNKFHQR